MKRLSPYLLIVLLGAAVFSRSLGFDYTYCDDYKILVEEHATLSGFSQVPEAFLDSFGNLYRPLLRLTWILDASLGGTDPWIYHLSNLIYHLIAACLVFFTLRGLPFARGAALGLSLIYTVHPLLVQAVVWIPGRNDTLATIFVLLCLITLRRFVAKPAATSLALHGLCFVLALFTKETAALFPLLGLFYLLGLARERLRSGRCLALLAGWGGLGLGWFLLRGMALAQVSSPDQVGWSAFLASWPALPAITGKVVLPWKLSGLATFDSLSICTGAVVLLGLVLVLIFRWRQAGAWAGFGLAWYLIFLLPTLFARVVTADDHFDYLEHRAALPLFGLLVFVLAIWFSREKPRGHLTTVVFLGVLGCLAGRSAVYSQTFQNAFTFWESAIAQDPGRSNFHSVLGKLHHEEKDLKRAAASFETACALSVRKDPSNHRNLAVIYREMGELEKAIDQYRIAIDLAPEDGDLRYFLGKIHFDGGDLEQAEPHLRDAFRLHPARTDAAILLVAIQAKRNRIDQAIETCEKVLEQDARHFHAMNILGSLHAGQGDLDQAAGYWRRILRIQPGHLPSLQRLVDYCLEREDLPSARQYAGEIEKRGGSLPPEVRARLNP